MQSGNHNVFETFQPLRELSTFFGLAPFRVDAINGIVHNRDKFRTAFIGTLYSIALLVLCVLGQQEPAAEESLLVQYGNNAVYLQLILLVIVAVVFNYIKRQTIASCLVVMHHFDCTMEVG